MLSKAKGFLNLGVNRSGGTMDVPFVAKAKELFAAHHWIFLACFIVVFTLVLQIGLSYALGKLHGYFLYTKSKWKQSCVAALRRPLLTVVWIAAITYLCELLLPIAIAYDPSRAAVSIRQFAAIVGISWFLLRWEKDVQQQMLASVEHDRPYEKAKLHMFGRLVTLSITLMGLIFGLQVLGVSLQAILTLGGVGGLALGIAGRDIFANFFSGFMIYITQPVIIGDWVRSPERQIEGIVEEIGWYYTCIRGFNKQPLYVPNSVFSTIVVVNPSRMTHWKIEEKVGIRYKNFEALRPLIRDIQQMLDNHPALDPSQDHTVYFDKFSQFSLDIAVTAYTTAIQKHQIGKIKQDILLQTGDIMASHGLAFAFPTTSLDMVDPVTVRIEATPQAPS